MRLSLGLSVKQERAQMKIDSQVSMEIIQCKYTNYQDFIYKTVGHFLVFIMSTAVGDNGSHHCTMKRIRLDFYICRDQ